MAIYKAINSRASSHAALRNVLKYVLDKSKSNERLWSVSGPYDYRNIGYKQVYSSFVAVKKDFGKDDGRMYLHTVLSFPPQEITPEQALEFAERFAEKTYGDHQVCFSVHEDKEHVHVHMIVNTVNYMNGKKIQKGRADLARDKEYCNDLCREYGLSVAEKGRSYEGKMLDTDYESVWNKNKYRALQGLGNELLRNCALATMRAMKRSKSKEEYIAKMKELGWEVTWTDNRKYITYKNENGKKVRSNNLEKTFGIEASKEALERTLSDNLKKSKERGKENARSI